MWYIIQTDINKDIIINELRNCYYINFIWYKCWNDAYTSSFHGTLNYA